MHPHRHLNCTVFPALTFSFFYPFASSSSSTEGQWRWGPPWLGSGVASAGREVGARMERTKRRGAAKTKRESIKKKETNTCVHTNKKKKPQLCPLNPCFLHLPHVLPCPLSFPLSVSQGRGLAGLGLNAICCIM